MVDGLWAKVMSGDGAEVACVTVRHSSTEPGGGVPVVESEMVGDALGTSLGGSECILWGIFVAGVGGVSGGGSAIFVAGVGGGSGGGNATVHATDGGGTTAVGPRPRHSLLVTSVSVVGVSIVRSLRESYSRTVQSI